MEELRDRIRRIYAAIGETVERELSRFLPTVSVSDHAVFFFQDFTGGLTEAQIANAAFAAIHALAHFPDHLRRWARSNGRPAEEVEGHVASSPELAIIIDLSNRDKHGPPRDGGRSGKAPAVRNLRRAFSLSAGPEVGAVAQVVFTCSGPVLHGSGSAAVIITGEIVASDGTSLGDLNLLLSEGLGQWEQLLAGWGVPTQGAA